MKSRLGNRLTGTLIVVALTFTTGLIAVALLSETARQAAGAEAALGETRALAGAVLKDCLQLELSLVQYLRTGDPSHAERFAAAAASARASLAQLEGLTVSDLQKQRVRTVSPLLDDWVKESGAPQIEARRRLTEMRVGSLVDPGRKDKKLQDVRGLLEEYLAEAAGEAKGLRAATGAAVFNITLAAVGGMALGFIVTLGAGWRLIKTVLQPILSLRGWVQTLKAGKPAALEIPAGDEIADLADSFLFLGGELDKARREFEMLAALPDTSPHPILQLRHSGEVAYANPAAQALAVKLNLTPPELLPAETPKQLEAMAGKEALLRRDRLFGETHYDFIFHSLPDSELVFVAALERIRRLPAAKPS